MTSPTLRILTPDEEVKFLAALTNEGHRYRVAALLMLTTGLRIGEVCALTIAHAFDSDTPRAFIELTPDMTKTKKGRTVPVPAQTRLALREYLRRIDAPLSTENQNIPLFKSSRSSESLTPRDFQRKFISAGRRVIHRAITPHMLRHTYATRMARALPLPDLAELLGHSDPRTTQIYYHADLAELAKAVEKARTIKPKPKRKRK